MTYSYQDAVHTWMLSCFGRDISFDTTERSHRFLEEALELVQAAGCGKAEALMLVDYVYDRPEGQLRQEVGGVMVTLAALCQAHGVSMARCGAVELARINGKMEEIRAKQIAKPRNSPLPQ